MMARPCNSKARWQSWRPRFESTIAADTAAKWNCGMPVVQPPADVDPKFERKSDDRISVAIRRAAPRACGR
jgi:hypothetical protein